MIVSCKSGVVNRIKSIYDFRLTIFDDVRSQGYFFKALDRLCKGVSIYLEPKAGIFALFLGSQILKHEPLFSSDSTFIVPPCSDTIFFTTNSPRPVPVEPGLRHKYG